MEVNYGTEETTSMQTSRRTWMWNRLAPHPRGQKFGRDISAAQSPRPTPGPPAQDSSARKISPYNFWLRKPADIESVQKAAGALSNSSWGTDTQTHLLRLAPSELQHGVAA